VQISFHNLEDQVQISVVFGTNRLDQFDDMGVLELREESHFSVGALGICGILECIKDLFEGDRRSSASIESSPDVAISSASHQFFGFVKSKDVIVNLFAHSKWK
jgi:hypothetical protein